MNVVITTFRNPFSFFCMSEDVAINVKDINITKNNNGGSLPNKVDMSGVNHGEYVAVLWDNNWARGIITLETQFLIWLIDYGIYLRPDEKTIYVPLPPEYKKYPTKVFEASIHGVAPVEKVLNDMCQIEDKLSTSWSSGAIKKGQDLVSIADQILFVPIAILSTKSNDVVLGELYFKIGKQTLNLIDELEKWPVCLDKNPEQYIEKLSELYKYRRQHRACLLKPVFLDTVLPTVTSEMSLYEYSALCDAAPTYDAESDDMSQEGSTITYIEKPPTDPNEFKLTAKEIEQYSNAYVTVSGIEHNVLNVLLNKARDLCMCEKYQDTNSIGRATSRSSRFLPNVG